MNGRALGYVAKQSWQSLRADPDCIADWQANAGPPVHEPPPFPFRKQTVADLKAARWNLLAWEDPPRPLLVSLFWAGAPAVDARVVRAGDAAKYKAGRGRAQDRRAVHRAVAARRDAYREVRAEPQGGVVPGCRWRRLRPSAKRSRDRGADGWGYVRRWEPPGEPGCGANRKLA